MNGYLDSKISETEILTDYMKVSHHYYNSDVQQQHIKQEYTVCMNFHTHTAFPTQGTELPASKHIKLSTTL
jgi:hypothetical protein